MRCRSIVRPAVALLFAGVLAACGQSSEEETNMTQAAGVVTGTVLYRERMMLPPDAQLTVQLEDVSRPDAPATVLGTVSQPTSTAPPWAFRLSYDPAVLDKRHRYGLRATVRRGDRLMFTSDTFVDAFADAAPEIVLVRVPSSEPATIATEEAEPAALAGSRWQLVTLDGEPAAMGAGGKPVTLEFAADGSTAAGFSGCNRYTGGYTSADGQRVFSPLAVTRMACMEGAELEQRYLAVLASVDGFSLSGSRLQLSVGTSTVAVLEPLAAETAPVQK